MRKRVGDFGSLVVKTLRFHCRGHRLDPSPLGSCMLRGAAKKKKKKKMCDKDLGQCSAQKHSMKGISGLLCTSLPSSHLSPLRIPLRKADREPVKSKRGMTLSLHRETQETR